MWWVKVAHSRPLHFYGHYVTRWRFNGFVKFVVSTDHHSTADKVTVCESQITGSNLFIYIYYIKFLKIKIFYSKLHIFAPYIIPTYNNLVNFSIFENLFQGVVNHPDLKLNLYAVYFFYSFGQSCMVLEKISYKLSTLNSYQNWNRFGITKKYKREHIKLMTD